MRVEDRRLGHGNRQVQVVPLDQMERAVLKVMVVDEQGSRIFQQLALFLIDQSVVDELNDRREDAVQPQELPAQTVEGVRGSG